MKLTTCCGCCSLKTGSLIIGILNLIGGFIALIVTSKLTADIDLYGTSTNDDSNRSDQNNNSNLNVQAYTKLLIYILKSMAAGALTYVIIMFILVVSFIFGIVKRQPRYVLPFVCVSFSNLLSGFTAVIGVLTLVCFIPYISGALKFLCFFTAGISLGIQGYLWLVILYFYKELVAERFGQVPERSGIIMQ